MQKWSPDPLLPATEAAGFVSDGGTAVDVDNVSGFRPDQHGTGGADILSVLTRAEREQVYEMVEADVTAEYEAKFAAAESERAGAVENLLTRIAEEVDRRKAEIFREMAAGTARIAIEIAERILRARVELDPEVLARLLESMQHRALQEDSFEISVNPDDARYLADSVGLLERLHISKVVEDRRIDAGGCMISAGTREWDATLTGQLESVAEEVTALLMLPPDRGDAEDGDPAAVE